MLKRFLAVAAMTVLPLAMGCGSNTPSQSRDQSSPSGQPANPPAGQPSGQGADQPASAPGAQPTSQAAGQPAAQSAGQPASFAAAKTGTPAGAPGESRNPISKMADNTPEFREVTIPAGTVLPVELQTSVHSESSNVEDQVRGTLRRAVTIDGHEVLPAGSALAGVVTDVQRSGRVKGRAHVALRFSSIAARDERMDIRTEAIGRTAPATKKEDATKIGVGAGAGAVIGGIVGGGSGAAKGAAIGGAGGTGVVLATRGKEVSIPAGTSLSVKLTEPITVRVPVSR
jgi:hypothetical protein